MNHDDDDETTEGGKPRRSFMRTAAAAAVGAGVLAVAGDAAAKPGKKKRNKKKRQFEFSTNIAPAALTEANINKITSGIAAQLANEAKVGVEQVALGFHIRIGGGHSRIFSKTADHKNVSHSEVIVEGSGP